VRVRLSRAAVRDRDAAIVYYGDRFSELGRRFNRHLRDTLLFIQRYPEGAPVIADTLRAKVIIGFPYSIIYEMVEGEILVASIACHYRDPDAYRDR
jgi:plasmid stabilization system protein ParE